MKIAIVGAGFTGLAAAVKLADEGHKVEIFEANDKPGGLAAGFRPNGWDWSLEYFYHHVFAEGTDKAIAALAEKVGWSATYQKPLTNSWVGAKEKQLDSPLSLLKFDELSIWSRLWMGMGLAILKLIPNGKFLERFRVVDLLPWLVGQEGYQKVWKRLLAAKFGRFVSQVNMAWFWARVYKRTAKLGYFEGGFEKLAERCVEYIKQHGGAVNYKIQILNIKELDKYDKILITVPAPQVDRIIGEGKVKWPNIDYLWGQTLVLELDRSILKSYWLNILEKDWPFLVAVEHTNFMDKKHYGNRVVVYLGNYLEEGDKRLKMDEKDLLNLFAPYIKKIKPEFEKNWVKRMWKWQLPYSQPVFPVDYSKQIPGFKTSLPNVFVANMSMVYPFDRGTNYAVEMGEKVACEIK